MENERKIKMLKYLYPTEKIRQFMCNDLYEELDEIIEKTDCISYDNIKNATRKEKLNKVTGIVKNFIECNKNYKDILAGFFGNKDIDELTSDIVIGYVFYISKTSTKYSRIDIFKDKKSICYAPISIIDFL